MSMGFDVLSMNSTNLLVVKHTLSHFSFRQGQKILRKVLAMDDAYLIKDYVNAEMRKAGLGDIVRSRHYS